MLVVMNDWIHGAQLPAKCIFHAVTIDYTSLAYASEQSNQSATLKCMQRADTLGVRLIAFPALGTGIASFPFQLAAEVMTQTVANYLMGDTDIDLRDLRMGSRNQEPHKADSNDLRSHHTIRFTFRRGDSLEKWYNSRTGWCCEDED